MPFTVDSPEYWQSFTISGRDLERVEERMLDTGTPQPIDDLAEVVIRGRLDDAVPALLLALPAAAALAELHAVRHWAPGSLARTLGESAYRFVASRHAQEMVFERFASIVTAELDQAV